MIIVFCVGETQVEIELHGLEIRVGMRIELFLDVVEGNWLLYQLEIVGVLTFEGFGEE